MTIEEQVVAALQGLAGGRVFPDVAPEKTQVPYITYQAVGGEPVNFLTGEQPGKTNTRIQINVWAASRIEASQLGAQVEAAMRAAVALQPEVLTGRMSTFDEITRLRGMLQDFSIWY
jgi:tetrahydromethanopterin S-methyltransferase subunit E